MPLDAHQWALILTDQATLARYRRKLLTIPGDDCLWWTGAISGRGHGRFWIAQNHVIIAHRLAYALTAGPNAAATTPVLGHRCDNPLCQRVDPNHITPSTPQLNRREWAARRTHTGSPLGDQRGARHRATTLRDLARQDPGLLADELARLRRHTGEQPALWT